MPYSGQCLNVGRVEDSRGSTRLARLAKTLPAINCRQTVGCLELIGKSADLIQHLKLVLGVVSSTAARLSWSWSRRPRRGNVENSVKDAKGARIVRKR